MKSDNLVGLLEYLAQNLVDYPEDVFVDRYESGRTVHLELQVSPDDIGRVIGKQGRIAKAIRTVMRAAATRKNEKVYVEID